MYCITPGVLPDVQKLLYQVYHTKTEFLVDGRIILSTYCLLVQQTECQNVTVPETCGEPVTFSCKQISLGIFLLSQVERTRLSKVIHQVSIVIYTQSDLSLSIGILLLLINNCL